MLIHYRGGGECNLWQKKRSILFLYINIFLHFYLHINIILSFMELNFQFTPRPNIHMKLWSLILFAQRWFMSIDTCGVSDHKCLLIHLPTLQGVDESVSVALVSSLLGTSKGLGV